MVKGKGGNEQRLFTFVMFSTDQSWFLSLAPEKEVAAGIRGTLLFSPFEKRHFHKARNHSTYNYIFLQSQFCLLTKKYLSASKAPGAFFFFPLLALIKAFEHLCTTAEADPQHSTAPSQAAQTPPGHSWALPWRSCSLWPWGRRNSRAGAAGPGGKHQKGGWRPCAPSPATPVTS